MEGNTTVKAASVIVVLSVLSKVFGLFRDVALAGVFGASFATDSYLIATLIPNLLFASVGAAIVTTFIPLYSEEDEKKSSEARDIFVATFFKVVIVVSLLLSVLGIIFAPLLVSVMAPGFSGEVRELTIDLTRIMMPVIVFLGAGGVAKGILNYNNDFHTPASVGIFQNIIIIISILLLGTTTGIVGVTVGTLIGFSMNLWVLLPKIYKLGVPILRGMDIYHPKIKKGLYLMAPVLLGNAVIQINELIDRMLASGLVEGSVTALSFASKVFILPHGIFVIAIVTALYPSMSKMANKQDYAGLKHMLFRGLTAITFIIFPIMILTIFLREEIITLLFERGEFDPQATERTAIALLFYTFGMLSISLNEILKRTFYSRQDTRTPIVATVFTVIINIALNFLLIGPLGHGGLALATSIAVFTGTLLLAWGLRRSIGPFGFSRYLKSLFKIFSCSLVLGIWLFIGTNIIPPGIFDETFIGIGLKILTLTFTGLLLYFAAAMLLKSEELNYMQELLKNYLNK